MKLSVVTFVILEAIVAESVVVTRRLLQLNPTKNKDIIKHMAKMIDKITVPMARASIIWLIGEYSERIPKVAPGIGINCSKNLKLFLKFVYQMY